MWRPKLRKFVKRIKKVDQKDEMGGNKKKTWELNSYVNWCKEGYMKKQKPKKKKKKRARCPEWALWFNVYVNVYIDDQEWFNTGNKFRREKKDLTEEDCT